MTVLILGFAFAVPMDSLPLCWWDDRPKLFFSSLIKMCFLEWSHVHSPFFVLPIIQVVTMWNVNFSWRLIEYLSINVKTWQTSRLSDLCLNLLQQYLSGSCCWGRTALVFYLDRCNWVDSVWWNKHKTAVTPKIAVFSSNHFVPKVSCPCRWCFTS